MKISNLFLLSLVSCLLSFSTGCRYSKEYQTIDAGNKFTIAVPSWLKKDEKLKPGADFQYANHYRNIYAIAETADKSKADFATTMNGNLNNLRKAMSNATVSDSVEVTVGGLKGERVEIFGKMNGENIYFSEVLLNGQNNFYHISIWIRSEDRKLKYKEDIDHIINSFKEKG